MIERDDHIPPLAELVCGARAGARAVRTHPGGAARRAAPAARRGGRLMSGLARLQAIFRTTCCAPARLVGAHVLGTRACGGHALGIYAGAYGSRLADALQSNFPALAKAAWRGDFHTLAADTCARTIAVLLIRYYGDALPQVSERSRGLRGGSGARRSSPAGSGP